jgi:putative MFS transporter
MMIGALIGGFASDQYGRKVIFVGSIAITSVFGLVSAFSPSYHVFLVLRTIVGIGLGASIPTDFSLFMEFIPKKSRGTILGMMNIYWVVGHTLECILSYLCMTKFSGRTNTPLGWKYLVLFSSLPGFGITALRFFAHESPRYLLSTHENRDKVMNILKSIAKMNGTLDRLPKGQLVYPHGKCKKLTLAEQFNSLFSRQYAMSTIILCFVWFCMSYGSGGFNFLLPSILQKISNANAYLNSLMIVAVGFVANILTLIFMDRIGRRQMLIVFLVASGVTTVCIGTSKLIYVLLSLAMISSFLKTFAWSAIYTYSK